MDDPPLPPDKHRIRLEEVDFSEPIHFHYSREHIQAMQRQARLEAGLPDPPVFPVLFPAVTLLAVPARARSWWQRLLGL